MKWGRKKKPLTATSSSPSPLSSRSSSVVSRVFPISWLSSKFKQQPAKSSEPEVALATKLKQNMILSSKNETFYGADEDDGFWRLSFGEDGVDQRRKGGSLFKSERVGHHRENELEILHREDEKLFSNMVSDIRKIRQVPADIKVVPVDIKVTEVLTPREKGLKPRKSQRKQDQLESKPVLTIRTSERNKPEFKKSGSRKVSDDYYTKPRNYNEGDGEEEEEDLQKNRRSLYISRRASSKVNVQSPRTPFKVEACKIKAIEDMKKAKMKNQKKKKKKIRDDEERKRFESFAIVKNSFNVQRDFRDSMVEMIIEKGISQPGELEDLLACYLTLNSDDCHELIIKVFRQVWFDLNHACDDPKW